MSQQKDKRLAVSLLREREEGAAHTYAAISERTGYGRKQLTRLLAQIREGLPDEEILRHGNAGRRPPSPASDSEAGACPGAEGVLRGDNHGPPQGHLPRGRRAQPREGGARPRPGARGAQRELVPGPVQAGGLEVAGREARGGGRGAGAPRHQGAEPAPRHARAGGRDLRRLARGNGDTRVPRLAVDDATSSVLGGSFMPTRVPPGVRPHVPRGALALRRPPGRLRGQDDGPAVRPAPARPPGWRAPWSRSGRRSYSPAPPRRRAASSAATGRSRGGWRTTSSGSGRRPTTRSTSGSTASTRPT